MCSVPLQLEQILDGMGGGEAEGGVTHHPDGGGEDAQTAALKNKTKKKNPRCFRG